MRFWVETWQSDMNPIGSILGSWRENSTPVFTWGLQYIFGLFGDGKNTGGFLGGDWNWEFGGDGNWEFWELWDET